MVLVGARIEMPDCMRICIYTAIYGGYDGLRPQPKQSIPTDFVCVTDAHIAAPAPWKVIRDHRFPSLHPRLRAKWHKTHPHVIFGDGRLLRPWRWLLRRYTYTIWIDGSVQLISPGFATSSLLFPTTWKPSCQDCGSKKLSRLSFFASRPSGVSQ